MFKSFCLTVDRDAASCCSRANDVNLTAARIDSDEFVFSNGITLYLEPFDRFEDSRIATHSSLRLQLLNGCLFDDCGKEFTQSFFLGSAEVDASRLSELRGSFSGFVIDLETATLRAFTDHFGSKPLYFYEDDTQFIIGSSAFFVARCLQKRRRLEVSLIGAYSLLTYAYMFEDNTLFSGVRRLAPGTLLELNLLDRSSSIAFEPFYRFDNDPYNISYAEAVNTLDDLFMQAVERQVRLNNERGFRHLCALSAGLDSRMTAFALKRCGVTDVLYYTYSQSKRMDCMIPLEICSKEGWEWLLLTLDQGSYQLDIDEAIEISDGTNYYLWAAQLTSFLRLINSSLFGLVHTGVIGDVVVGSFVHRSAYKRRDRYTIGDGAYSTKLLPALRECVKHIDRYRDYEEGMMANRALNGACLGYSQSYARCAEAYSPFMDVDVFSFCMHVPIEMRMGHKLYYRWVCDKYPEAAAYRTNGRRIVPNQHEIIIGGTPIPLTSLPELARNKLRPPQKASMNPTEQWYAENEAIRKAFDDYFFERLDVLDFSTILKSDALKLFSTGTALEKAQCISLVGSLAHMSF